MKRFAPWIVIASLFAAYFGLRGPDPHEPPKGLATQDAGLPESEGAVGRGESVDPPVAGSKRSLPLTLGAAAVEDRDLRLALQCMPDAGPDDPGLADLADLIRLNTSRDPADIARVRELSLAFVRDDPGGCAASTWGSLDEDLDPEAWREMLALYDAAVAPDDAPTAVIAAYGGHLAVADRGKALDLLGRLQQREPDNPQWLDDEGHMHMLDINGSRMGGVGVKESATLAQEAYGTAIELAEGDQRVDLLGKGVVAAALAGDADAAEDWGQTLLRLAGDDANANHARHIGHEGLGLAALLSDDSEGAIAELLQMADVPPGPVQLSFGPNMRLANEMLQRGHRDAVVDYLERVSTFWKPDGVAVWLEQIRGGGTPTLNQFAVPTPE